MFSLFQPLSLALTTNVLQRNYWLSGIFFHMITGVSEFWPLDGPWDKRIRHGNVKKISWNVFRPYNTMNSKRQLKDIGQTQLAQPPQTTGALMNTGWWFQKISLILSGSLWKWSNLAIVIFVYNWCFDLFFGWFQFYINLWKTARGFLKIRVLHHSPVFWRQACLFATSQVG